MKVRVWLKSDEKADKKQKQISIMLQSDYYAHNSVSIESKFRGSQHGNPKLIRKEVGEVERERERERERGGGGGGGGKRGSDGCL